MASPMRTVPLRTLAVVVGSNPARWAQSVFFRVRDLEYWRSVAEAGGLPTTSK